MNTTSTMKRNAIVACSLIGAIILIIILMRVYYTNKEKGIRNQITAKQRDNQSQLDNVQKTISQSVQVTDLQMTAIKDVIVGNAQARKGGSGSLATLVHEAVPNLDTKSFTNLQNIIAGSRASWTTRQTELLDLKREHDNLIDQWPSSSFNGDKGKIEVIIVTSAAVKENFVTGEDNNVDLTPRLEK